MKNPGMIFEGQIPEIVRKLTILLYFGRQNTWKNEGTRESGSRKIMVRRNLAKIVVRTMLLFSSNQDRAYRHFLKPESCVPAAFLDKNSGTLDFGDFLQTSLLATPFKLKINKGNPPNN